MKDIMNLKFNRKIQKVLSNLFFDEEYHQYTLGEFTKIMLGNIVFILTLVGLMLLTAI
jgi:hypothetical protein